MKMITEINTELARIEKEKEIKTLLAVKKELRIGVLNKFLEQKIEFYGEFVNQIEQTKKPETATLDNLFKETIFEVWK